MFRLQVEQQRTRKGIDCLRIMAQMERTADGRIRTTEWEDIQYKHGNKVGKYQTHEMQLLAQRIADANPNIQLKSYDATEEKVRDKLQRGGYDVDPEEVKDIHDIGSDDDDDDALAAFRQRRMAEIQQIQQTHVFGVVRHIPGSDYVKEITESSENCWVVGIMTSQGLEDCDVLLKVMSQVASRHRDVKFVSLYAKEAVAKLPDRLLPCVVLYHKGALVCQMTQLDQWKDGKTVTVDSVERLLGRYGTIQREDEEESMTDDLDERVAWRSGDALRKKRL